MDVARKALKRSLKERLKERMKKWAKVETTSRSAMSQLMDKGRTLVGVWGEYY